MNDGTKQSGRLNRTESW